MDQVLETTKIKWSYATHVFAERPAVVGDASAALQFSDQPPQPNDVILAEVIEIGRHKRIELVQRRKSMLFPGDIVGVAYGHRYATRQWRGRIPQDFDTCHMLSVGGVCGEVVDKAPSMSQPTTLRPLGYLRDRKGHRINLKQFGLCPVNGFDNRPTVVLVVGSAMDSGKTTSAFSVIKGLTRSGAKVAAAKLTGTACLKDILLLSDAGATNVLDFSDVGHASTAKCDATELSHIATSIMTNLSSEHPDYIVLEIADGIVQQETGMLLDYLCDNTSIDYVLYTCNDTMGILDGIRNLRERGMNVVAVSGMVACSPLSRDEGQAVTEIPVLLSSDLQNASITELLPRKQTPIKGVLNSTYARTPVVFPKYANRRTAG